MKKTYCSIVFAVFSLLVFAGNSIASTNQESAEQSTSASVSEQNVNLSLQDAIYYSLQGNNDIKIASYGPQIAEQGLGKAEAAYDPVFVVSGGANRLDRPTQSLLDTGEIEDDSLVEDRWSTKAEIKKHVSTGGSFSIFQEVGDLESNSTFVVPNPQSTSRLVGQFTQPLLRGIGDKETKSSIQIAQTNIDMSEEEFQQKVMDVMLEVITSYWQVKFNKESYLLDEKVIIMAEEIYRKEQVRLSQGISKQLDVDRAIAAIQTRKSSLYRTQIDVDNSVNRLKYLINSPELSVTEAGVGLTPTETPSVDLLTVDIDDAVEVALNNRTEILIEEQRLEMARIKMELADHNKLPRLDAKLDYILSSLDTNAGDAIKEVYSTDNDGWAAWVEFEVPLGNNAAQSDYQMSLLEYKRAQENIRRIKEIIITEVYSTSEELRNAVRQLQAAETAFHAREKVLVSEEALYELAQKTNEDLLASQQHVNVSHQEYIRAVTNYNKILARFSRVKGTILEEYNVNLQ